MTALFLLTALAFAGDTEGIVQVPEGSTIIFAPDPETGETAPSLEVPEFSFLMPEPMYDNALAKAKKLKLCEPDRDQCYETADFWMRQSQEALSACTEQLDADEEWMTRALNAEGKVQGLRTQRNTAWAITGGLIVGAVAVTAVAIGG